MDNKTKEEILREAKEQVARFNGWESFDEYYQQTNKLGVLDLVEDAADKAMESYSQQSTKLLLEEKKLDHEEVIKQRDAITELSKKLFTADQSTKHLQDRVKELEKEARQMIYKFMLSNELANRPDGEHIIETIEKWFLNTKS